MNTNVRINDLFGSVASVDNGAMTRDIENGVIRSMDGICFGATKGKPLFIAPEVSKNHHSDKVKLPISG